MLEKLTKMYRVVNVKLNIQLRLWRTLMQLVFL